MHAASFISVGGGGKRVPSAREKQLMEELVDLAKQKVEDKKLHVMKLSEFHDISHHFSRRGLKMTPQEVRTVFAMVEARKDRSANPCVVVDYSEEIRERAQTFIRAYDKNKDNKVSKVEMAFVSGSRLSKEAIENTFRRHDRDGDGKLDLREVEAMIKKRENSGTKNKS